MRGVLAYRAAHFHKPLLESQAPCPQTLPGKGLKAFHAGTPRASLTSLATFVISSLLSQQKSSLSYLLFFKMYPFIISRLLPSPASLGHLSPALPSPPCCCVAFSRPGSTGASCPVGRPLPARLSCKTATTGSAHSNSSPANRDGQAGTVWLAQTSK